MYNPRWIEAGFARDRPMRTGMHELGCGIGKGSARYYFTHADRNARPAKHHQEQRISYLPVGMVKMYYHR